MASMATGTADATDTLPSSGPASAPRPSGRVPLGIGAGLAATLLVVLALRLFSGRPLGVEDNGDGYRLFCGAGLTPLTIGRLRELARRLDHRLRRRPADLPRPGALVGPGHRAGDHPRERRDLVADGARLGLRRARRAGGGARGVGGVGGRTPARPRGGRPGAPPRGRDLPPVLRLHLQRARGPARLRHHGRRRRRPARHPPRAPRGAGGGARAHRGRRAGGHHREGRLHPGARRRDPGLRARRGRGPPSAPGRARDRPGHGVARRRPGARRPGPSGPVLRAGERPQPGVHDDPARDGPDGDERARPAARGRGADRQRLLQRPPAPRRRRVVGGRDPAATVRDPERGPAAARRAPRGGSPGGGRGPAGDDARRPPVPRLAARARSRPRPRPTGTPAGRAHASPTSRRSSTTHAAPRGCPPRSSCWPWSRRPPRGGRDARRAGPSRPVWRPARGSR